MMTDHIELNTLQISRQNERALRGILAAYQTNMSTVAFAIYR